MESLIEGINKTKLNLRLLTVAVLIYELYSKEKNVREELYKTDDSSFIDECVVGLQNLGYITYDSVKNEFIPRAPLLKLFEPNGDSITEIINHLNDKTGRRFSTKTQSSRRFISGRLKEGYTVEDCKGVINTMVAKWGRDSKMRYYLRPETLFNQTKFQTYYNLYQENKQTSDEGDWTIDRA